MPSRPGALSFIASLFIVLLYSSNVRSASIAALDASLILGTLVRKSVQSLFNTLFLYNFSKPDKSRVTKFFMKNSTGGVGGLKSHSLAGRYSKKFSPLHS